MGCGTSRGARAGVRSASASSSMFQLEVTPCFVVRPLCFAFDMRNFREQDVMTLTQCAQCLVQIQHVDLRPCLWCAHCALDLT